MLNRTRFTAEASARFDASAPAPAPSSSEPSPSSAAPSGEPFAEYNTSPLRARRSVAGVFATDIRGICGAATAAPPPRPSTGVHGTANDEPPSAAAFANAPRLFARSGVAASKVPVPAAMAAAAVRAVLRAASDAPPEYGAANIGCGGGISPPRVETFGLSSWFAASSICLSLSLSFSAASFFAAFAAAMDAFVGRPRFRVGAGAGAFSFPAAAAAAAAAAVAARRRASTSFRSSALISLL